MNLVPLLMMAISLMVAGSSAATPAPPVAAADPVHNLVAIEFLESPTSGFAVTGGLLGVPDSAGRFPERYQRSDPVTGRIALPGRPAGGDLLVFTNLTPGSYRVAMVFLGESKLAKQLLKGEAFPEDRALVYGDTLSQLTFTVGDRQALYLGRLVRHTRPSLADTSEVWKSWIDWNAGDARRAFQSLAKRKDLAAWKDLVSAQLVTLEKSRGAAPER
jgi:hypothetical protein